MSTQFAEAEHPRDNDGRFASKHQAEAGDVSLDGPPHHVSPADQAAETAAAMRLVAGDVAYREVDAYVRGLDAATVVAKFYRDGGRWWCYDVDGYREDTHDVADRLEDAAIDGTGCGHARGRSSMRLRESGPSVPSSTSTSVVTAD